jgi:hypothetical protein
MPIAPTQVDLFPVARGEGFGIIVSTNDNSVDFTALSEIDIYIDNADTATRVGSYSKTGGDITVTTTAATFLKPPSFTINSLVNGNYELQFSVGDSTNRDLWFSANFLVWTPSGGTI